MSTVESALSAIHAGTAARKLEGERLEFKEAKPAFKDACLDLAEAAVCFANSSGGVIVVGVADRVAGPEAFVGCDLDAPVLRGRIYQLTTPGLLVEVAELHFSDVRLLTVTVPEGIEVYSTSKGVAYQRVNEECVPMRPSDVTRLTEERHGVDWSAASSGRPMDDVDPLALRYCRRLLQSSTDTARQSYARLSDRDLLSALHALADDVFLTRAGELMFCTQARCAPREVVVYQHRRTQGGEADAVLRLGTPLVFAFEEVVQAIHARQGITPVTLPDGQQLQIEDFPSSAVREAVVNAFIHGDWRAAVPIQIEHSPEYLRVVSPGPLVAGITVDNILTKGSKARYRELAFGFRTLGLAEEVGQGVDRMYREMIRSGKDVPLISESVDQVTVRFRGQPTNVRITKFLATLPREEQDDTDALLIIRVLCRKRSVTARDVAPTVQRTVDEAQTVLRRMSVEPVNILEPTRGTARRTFPAYRLRAEAVAALGPAVAYHTRAIDEIDRKIIDHIRDYGEVNNRTVQRLFDLDVYQARDVIQDLVGRELLVRVSQQTRGTAVRYGAGRAFPSRRSRRPARPQDT